MKRATIWFASIVILSLCLILSLQAPTAHAALTNAQKNQIANTLERKCNVIIGYGNTKTFTAGSAEQKKYLGIKQVCDKSKQLNQRQKAGSLITVCQATYKDFYKLGTQNHYLTSGGLFGGNCSKIAGSADLRNFAKGSSSSAGGSTNDGSNNTPSGGGNTGGGGGDQDTPPVDGDDSSPGADPVSGGSVEPGVEKPTFNCPGGDNFVQNADGDCVDRVLVDCAPEDGDVTVSRKCNLFVKYVNPAIKFLSGLVALAVVIGIISGGIRYATAADDPQKSATGKSWIKNSIVALIAFIFLNAALQWLIPGGIW